MVNIITAFLFLVLVFSLVFFLKKNDGKKEKSVIRVGV